MFNGPADHTGLGSRLHEGQYAAMDNRIQTACLLTLTTLGVGAALYWLRPVMIPFVLAALLAYVLAPLRDVLVERAKVPAGLALTLTLVIGVLILTGAAVLISGSVKQLASNSQAYQAHLQELAGQIAEFLRGWDVEFGVEELQEQLAKLPVGSWVVRVTNALIDLVSNTFLVLIFVVYLLAGGGGGDHGEVWAECDRQIKRYVNLKIALSAATGVLVGLMLWIIGVDLALVFGVFAFVLNFIPSVGSVFAVLLPVPLIVVSPDFTWTTLGLALALPGVVQFGIGNVLEPKLLGDSLDLHPITVLLALILWGMLWGIAGMLLAAPMTAVTKILLANLEPTRPVAELMAGRFGIQEPATVEVAS